MSATFIKIPAEIVEQGEERQDIRIPISDIRFYRKWKTRDGDPEKTVFFFRGKRGSLIVPLSIEEIDERVGVLNEL